MTEQQLDMSESSEAQDFAIADMLAAKLDESDPLAQPAEEMPADPLAGLSLADVLQPAIQTTFDLLKPGWRIKENESRALADSYAAVIDVFFPDMNVDPRFAAIGMAGLTTFAVIGPRVKADREAEEKAERKALEKQSQHDKPAPAALSYDKPAGDPLAWNKAGG